VLILLGRDRETRKKTMWKDYLPEKDKHVLEMHISGNSNLAGKFVAWIGFNDLLDSILPCDDFRDKDVGRFVLIAWWDAALKMRLIDLGEWHWLIRVGIDDLYF
jgi:hypothetical protein